ncbi:MAG: 23S rRNA (pseudouridine(1915)-N(3))-methyltransferase RlmH [Lachnospiraceae bacterium]|nr:23S rRNA (pseudouridine(1915)-N(3))-methyltransferase RlmH [Lachnospiraceae bacterium]
MNISLIILSKKPEKYYIQAIEEYMKRLSRYANAGYTFIKKEAEFEKCLKKQSYVFAVKTGTSTTSSTDFADTIQELSLHGTSDISFVIGLEPEHYNDTLFLSCQELSPSLTGVALSEQIYRAYRILNNEPYHK